MELFAIVFGSISVFEECQNSWKAIVIDEFNFQLFGYSFTLLLLSIMAKAKRFFAKKGVDWVVVLVRCNFFSIVVVALLLFSNM